MSDDLLRRIEGEVWVRELEAEGENPAMIDMLKGLRLSYLTGKDEIEPTTDYIVFDSTKSKFHAFMGDLQHVIKDYELITTTHRTMLDDAEQVIVDVSSPSLEQIIGRNRKRIGAIMLVDDGNLFRGVFSWIKYDEVYAALKTLGRIYGKNTNNTSLLSLLEKAGIPVDRIQVVADLDCNPTNLKHTSDTYTGLVLKVDDCFVKVGVNIPMLAREEAYMRLGWEHPILRPTMTQLVSYNESDGFGVLVTKDVSKNSLIISQADYAEHLRVRSSVFDLLIRDVGTEEKSRLKKIPQYLIIDIFNLALHHEFMARYRNNFDTDIIPTTRRFDELLSWSDGNRLEGRLLEFSRFYEGVRKRVGEYQGRETVVNYDGHQVFFRDSIRPFGDFGMVKAGTPSWALGPLVSESRQISSDRIDDTALLYNKVRRSIREICEMSNDSPDVTSQSIAYAGFLHSMNIAAFKMSRGLDPTPSLASSTSLALAICQE